MCVKYEDTQDLANVSIETARAIELVAKGDPKTPPKDFDELLERLAAERGAA